MSGFVVGVKEGRVVEHSLFSYFSDHCTYDLGKLNINLSNTMSDTLHPWEDAHDPVLEQGPELVLGEAGLDVELDVHVAVLLHLPGHRQHLVLHLNTHSLVYTPQNICYLPNLLRIIIRQQAVDVIHQLLQLQFWNEAISWKGKDQKYQKWKMSLSIIYLPVDVESVEEFGEDLLGRSSLHDVEHHLQTIVDH